MSFGKFTRRDMLKFLAAPPLLTPLSPLTAASGEEAVTDAAAAPGTATSSATAPAQAQQETKKLYPQFADGPASSLFQPLALPGNKRWEELDVPLISQSMKESIPYAPTGSVTSWGIPFNVGKKIVFIKDSPVTIKVQPVKARWLVLLHTSDMEETERDESGFYQPPFKGSGRLGEHIADYTITYEDGSTVAHPIKHRYQLGMVRPVRSGLGLESVTHNKPFPIRPHHEQRSLSWGQSQTRARLGRIGRWLNWMWAWENPHPEKRITELVFQPKAEAILISAISTGDVRSHPLRWKQRSKAVLTLPSQVEFDPELDQDGQLSQIQLDMGQIISATPRFLYPDSQWSKTYNNKLPEISKQEILLEYSAHPDAMFHFYDGKTIPVSNLEKALQSSRLKSVAPAHQKVLLRIVDKQSKKPVAVKLHIHGQAGEYLPPMDRHRIPNPAWFEDYSVDFVHRNIHNCTYIPGETEIKLPLGKVYLELSKGFEIKPVRKILEVKAQTQELTLELEKVLPWREKGWVSADTHVHFLSPSSALLEGAGEGVNVINLLASQWGELMTNVGDFDGKTTYGSKKTGGDGEYLVRVGTENRQHILGHISLLGYEGRIIVPMTSAGVPESAIGDPVEVLLTQWAMQCKEQGGVVILPHFPNPRSEHAVNIVSGNVDGVEMTSWGNLYGGIDPYSLADWYRYLNCGYFVAAVGGTDKMTARVAVGTVRTYAKIDSSREFDLDTWKNAIRKGQTFVTYGPLMEFAVDGKSPGDWIKMSRSGGTVDVTWNLASVTVPMTKVEVMVNGEVRDRQAVQPWQDQGHFKLKVDKSSWVALLVRGHYKDKPEIITAHSSPVMISVEGSEFFSALDAVTILDQIEGALTFLDTVGTRAENEAYKRMRMLMESTHRKLHNRMHQQGMFHNHSPKTDHHRK